MILHIHDVVVFMDKERIHTDLFKVADIIKIPNEEPTYMIKNENFEREANRQSLWRPLNVKVCKYCGYFHPVDKVFVDHNTREKVKHIIWCTRCEREVTTIYASQYYFERIIKLKSI